MIYNPKFEITTRIINYLGKIEASREIVNDLAIPLTVEGFLQQEASVKMSHYSTKIEGNRLTLRQTKDLINGKEIIAREVDKREVMNYYNCLEWIYNSAQLNRRISEKDIKEMHAIIQKGIVKGKLRGQYRQAQNAVYDAQTGKPVYLPPETKDVAGLMKALVKWLNNKSELHFVIKAAIAHYQLVTIHPFMDGNGRTARALATLVLYQNNYDLKQFYSLEEYYAEDLKGYYEALHKCQGSNYYQIPAPDITIWLDYFIKGVAIIFEEVKEKALSAAEKHIPQRSKKDIELLQAVGPRERKVLSYFSKQLQLRTKNICTLFHIKERTARDLLLRWVKEGLIERRGTGKRDAYYVLSEDYRRLIGG